MKINDAVFGAVFLLLGVVVLVHVQAFPRFRASRSGPRCFRAWSPPGSPSAALLLIVSGIRHRAEQPWYETADWMRSGRHVVAFAAIVGGVVAYVLLANTIGFLLVAPVLLFVWCPILGVRPLPAVVVAIVGTLLIWYAFYKLLSVPLPWGVSTRFAF